MLMRWTNLLSASATSGSGFLVTSRVVSRPSMESGRLYRHLRHRQSAPGHSLLANGLPEHPRLFLGSDGFPRDAQPAAARDLNSAIEAGWSGFAIAERLPLANIARADEWVEHPNRPGRVVVTI